MAAFVYRCFWGEFALDTGKIPVYAFFARGQNPPLIPPNEGRTQRPSFFLPLLFASAICRLPTRAPAENPAHGIA